MGRKAARDWLEASVTQVGAPAARQRRDDAFWEEQPARREERGFTRAFRRRRYVELFSLLV